MDKKRNYFKDSLVRIRIFPPKTFYEQTNLKLSESAPILTDEKDHYKRHKRWMNSWIKKDVQNGKDRVVTKHEHLDLRTKLKI